MATMTPGGTTYCGTGGVGHPAGGPVGVGPANAVEAAISAAEGQDGARGCRGAERTV